MYTQIIKNKLNKNCLRMPTSSDFIAHNVVGGVFPLGHIIESVH